MYTPAADFVVHHDGLDGLLLCHPSSAQLHRSSREGVGGEDRGDLAGRRQGKVRASLGITGGFAGGFAWVTGEICWICWGDLLQHGFFGEICWWICIFDRIFSTRSASQHGFLTGFFRGDLLLIASQHGFGWFWLGRSASQHGFGWSIFLGGRASRCRNPRKNHDTNQWYNT